MKIVFVNWPRENYSLLVALRAMGHEVLSIRETLDYRRLNIQLIQEKLDADVIYLARVGLDIPSLTLRMFSDIALLMRLCKTPIVYGILEPTLIKHPYRPTDYVYLLYLLCRLPILRLFVNTTCAVHVLNTWEYKLYKLLLNNLGRVYYIPYNVDTRVFCIANKEDLFTVAFVWAEWRRGADIAYILMKSLLKKLKDIKFKIFAGRGTLIRLFYEIKRSYHHNVEIISRLSPAEFAKALARSHILLFPSRYEVFGRVVLEALSCGLPVVCFNIPGAPQDIVLRFKHLGIGYVAKPFDIRDLLRGLTFYYKLWKKSPESYFEISRTCRKIAEKFDTQIIAKKFEAMFEEVLKITSLER